MAICVFFQQGRCRFGDKCKNEHPGRSTVGGNRFGALSGGGFGSNYGIHENDIKHDLSAGKGRPEWIFSCYAPQRDIPRQLFGGPQREQSMEEMRLRHYEAVAAGNMNQAIQEAEALWNEFNQQMNAALNDTKAAVKYVVDGANEHPNRLDIVAGKTGPVTNQGTPLGQPSAFGQPAHTSTQPSAFGQPAFGQAAQPTAQPSPFGQPAFGQPSQPSTQQSAFGKPGFGQPGFGQPAQPTGQPSPFGQPAFGQPSQPNAQPSAFGQPAFGQPSQPSVQPSPFGQPAFGQPSQPNAQPSPFGKPAFGQPSQPTGQPSAFGQPAFGQPSQPNAQPSAFGQPAFGQPSQPNTQPSAFGKPAFGQPSQSNAQPSAFGQPAFGQPSQPSTQPSAFGQPAFGQPSQPSTQPSAFGQPAFGQATQPSAPAAGAASAAPSNIHSGPRPFIKIDDPSQLNPFPPLQGETRYNPASKTLTMWKGRPVQQVQVADGNLRPVYLHPQDNKTLVRVMFPDGPPDAASLRDAEGKPEEYTPEIEEAYKFFIENGYFKDGVLPSVPPKREWVSFDF
ncbi:hypothetical protein N7532_001753 [Penicillium argentinense]|uniref:C3H1-type domain-containing protein n=1 Tax=Penicillium argentinense TaxID=1131581 RepID=A0A9W9G386_9EURO|nr:uncharacterized protein N7532_001753 [Penicillium argentinense]KAJ5111218.1 hypothetical protein N7532_001753 [Penicillium argentinense]